MTDKTPDGADPAELVCADAADQCNAAGNDETFDREISRHDIHASLSIIKGFNQVLELSVVEMCDIHRQMFDDTNVVLPQQTRERLDELESECRFCLTRLDRCLKQLGERFTAFDQQTTIQTTHKHRDVA